MTVQFRVDWANGTLDQTANTYTFASPDIPTSGTFTDTGDATIDVVAAAPWNGQSLFNCSHWYDGAHRASLSNLTASAIRFLVQLDLTDIATDAQYEFFRIYNAADSSNGKLTIGADSAGNLNIRSQNPSFFEEVEWAVAVTTLTHLNVEVIADTNNATESQRLRARYWAVDGSAPSFTNRTGGDGSGQRTTATPDKITLCDPNNNGHTGTKFGKIFVSDDITEDLSALVAGTAAVPVFAHHYRQQGMQ